MEPRWLIAIITQVFQHNYPNMIPTIAIHEFRSVLRERRFRVAALLLSVLFAFSLFGTLDNASKLRQQHDEASATAREIWENQEAANPHSAAHYGTYVFKHVHPLAFFDQGVDAYTGNTLFLEAHKMNEPQHKAVDDRHTAARFGTLTPAFVLGILFPLFIMVFGFGSVTNEKTQGNLRLLMAQGVKRSSLFFGKALGLWFAVLLLALPFLLLGGLGLWQMATQPEDWHRYLLLSAAYLTYLGCFIHLTLLLSAMSNSTNTALVGCIGLWIVICLIAPKAAVNIAREKHPAPKWSDYHAAIEEDLKNGVDGHDPSDAHTEKLKDETLRHYGVEKVEQLPFNWAGFIMQKGEEHETYVFQKHRDQLLNIYDAQQRIQRNAAWLSPFLLLNTISQRLAGTDINSYFEFLAAAEQYRIRLVGDLNNDLKDNFKYGDWEGKRDKSFFATNARFEYNPTRLSDLLPEMSTLFGILMLWLILSGFCCYYAFHQLKPV